MASMLLGILMIIVASHWIRVSISNLKKLVEFWRRLKYPVPPYVLRTQNPQEDLRRHLCLESVFSLSSLRRSLNSLW